MKVWDTKRDPQPLEDSIPVELSTEMLWAAREVGDLDSEGNKTKDLQGM